jgi:hypothetical protein
MKKMFRDFTGELDLNLDSSVNMQTKERKSQVCHFYFNMLLNLKKK